LNLIAGRFLPDRGRILLDGIDMTRWSEHRRAQYIGRVFQDRKSTRLNSSHVKTSYAVFCLKKKMMPSSDSTLWVSGRCVNWLWRDSTWPVFRSSRSCTVAPSPQVYPLSLHDALPISQPNRRPFPA